MASIWLLLACLFLQAFALKRTSQVTNVLDLFPYKFEYAPGKLALLPFFSSSSKPDYVAVYELDGGDINFVLAPPKYCQSVWLCFGPPTNTSNSKTVQNFDMKNTCEESLRFVSEEQMVYHTTKSGVDAYVQATAFVQISASATPNHYSFEVWDDLTPDADDITTTKSKKISLNLDGKEIFVFASSPYCHISLFQQNQREIRGHSLNFGPTGDMSAFLKHDKDGVPTYFLTGTQSGSTLKSQLPKSVSYFDRTKSSFKKSTVNCCPSLIEFEGFLDGDDWEVNYRFITFTSYKLKWVTKHGGLCKKNQLVDNANVFHRSFRIEIGDTCEWAAVCFDPVGSGTVCANDANLLGLVFVHDVYIPTDSDQAVQMPAPPGRSRLIRINFVHNEGAIEMAHFLYSRNSFGVTHEMQLESYKNANMDPTKIAINLVKAPKCQARIAQDLNMEHLTDEQIDKNNIQCIVVTECTCLN